MQAASLRASLAAGAHFDAEARLSPGLLTGAELAALGTSTPQQHSPSRIPGVTAARTPVLTRPGAHDTPLHGSAQHAQKQHTATQQAPTLCKATQQPAITSAGGPSRPSTVPKPAAGPAAAAAATAGGIALPRQLPWVVHQAPRVATGQVQQLVQVHTQPAVQQQQQQPV
jgi:hypothetical protein